MKIIVLAFLLMIIPLDHSYCFKVEYVSSVERKSLRVDKKEDFKVLKHRPKKLGAKRKFKSRKVKNTKYFTKGAIIYLIGAGLGLIGLVLLLIGLIGTLSLLGWIICTLLFLGMLICILVAKSVDRIYASNYSKDNNSNYSNNNGSSSSSSSRSSSSSSSRSSSNSKCSTVQCSGTTQKGSRCRNKTTSCSGRCHLH